MSRRRRPAPPTETPPPPARAPASEPEAVEAAGVLLDARGRAVRPGEPELLERRKVVRSLMALGVTRHQLVDAMGDQGYVVTESQASGDYDAVLREFQADYDLDKEYARAAIVRRLSADLPRLRRDKRWKEVAAHELLLARILGLIAPTKVQVEQRVLLRDSLRDALAGMSEEEIAEMAAEQLALEERAGRE